MRARVEWLAVVAALLAGATGGAAQAPGRALHPDFPLLDAEGRSVLESDAPVSPVRTCGTCHDAAYIEAHSMHSALTAGALEAAVHAPPASATDRSAWLREVGPLHVGGGEAEALELSCFQCHVEGADYGARAAELAGGRPAWASTALLASTALVERIDESWSWRRSGFTPEGRVSAESLRVGAPTTAACQACHGGGTPGAEGEPAVAGRLLERTGARFSGTRVYRSELNVRDKEELDRPFDVHAERLLGCSACHGSLNNPARPRSADDAAPAHLSADPRRLDVAEYLRQPDHTLALSHRDGGTTCVGCHEADAVHEWLPYKDRHMNAVACESCHVPALYGPVLQAIDWTLPSPDGTPRREYRGLGTGSDGSSLLTPTTPTLLNAGGSDGRLAPYNLVTSWRWIHGSHGAAVPQDRLRDALLLGADYHPAILAALDTDGDDALSEAERVLSDEAAVRAVADRLEAVGLEGVRIVGEVVAEPVHHGVARGEWATSRCSACHSRTAEGLAPVALAGSLPQSAAGAEVVRVGEAARAGGRIETVDGTLVLAPSPNGLYLLGRGHFDWVNRLGALAVLAVVLGAGVHGALRVRAHRRTPAPRKHGPSRRVYMYGAYERLWHWVQAFAILGLMVTGLLIHLPDLLSWASFRGMVRVHNVLGFLLLGNAALSLFYHLASGKVRQYVPRPRGFFSEAVEQALYYVRGIFRHERHPFEKRPDRRLNPLQKLTYLAILNVLLPVQVLTGLLIWLGQELQGASAGWSGLAVLAAVHTLAAWLFAAFLLMHIYLTTTGHTVTSNLQAMVVGWEEVEGSADDRGAEPGEAVPEPAEEEADPVAVPA